MGTFLDPAGWEAVGAPDELSGETVEAYRAAAIAGAAAGHRSTA